jgi:hypothetical protein
MRSRFAFEGLAARGRRSLVVLVLVVWTLTGCSKPQAKPQLEPEPLRVPSVPERVVAPVVLETADSAPEPEPPPETTMPTRRATPRPRARTETAKPEPPASDTAPDAAPAVAAAPAPLIRKPQAADPNESTRKIRDLIDRAGRDLARINYAVLKGETRQQYDQAKRFMEQAEEALRSKNFDIASYLADKAQTMARELVGQ